jgi:hypothetical protein
LETINIPANVNSIKEYAFDGCTSLTSVIFEGKTLEEVQAMEYYPWDINTSVIKVA